jgi:hypothetical protein
VLATYFPNVDWQGMAIDGNTVRGSRDADSDVPALQVLNAMVHELGIFIQTQAVSVGTNELRTIHDFLEELVLKRCARTTVLPHE